MARALSFRPRLGRWPPSERRAPGAAPALRCGQCRFSSATAPYAPGLACSAPSSPVTSPRSSARERLAQTLPPPSLSEDPVGGKEFNRQ